MEEQNKFASASLQESVVAETDNIPLAGWEMNLDTLLITLDPAHIRLLKNLAFENVPETITLLEYAEKYLHPDEIPLVKKEYQFLLEQKSNTHFSKRYELKFRLVKGCIRHFLINASYASEGVLHGFMQDITEIKNGSPQSNNQASLHSIIENTDDYIFILNTKEELVICNTKFKTIFDEMLGKDIQPGLKIAELLPADMREEWLEMFHRARNAEHVTKELTFALDKTRHLEVSVNPIINDEIITGVSFFIKDITERWRKDFISMMERRVMEQSFRHEPMQDILYNLLSSIEELSPNIYSYIAIRKGDALEWSARPRIPENIIKSIPVIPIGLENGSCGAAAFTKKPVLVMDIRESEHWKKYKDIVLLNGFFTSIAFPILNKDGFVIGTVGCFCKDASDVTDFELDLMDRVTKFSSLLIEKEQHELLQVSNNEQLKLISNSVPGMFFQSTLSSDGKRKFIYVSEKVSDYFGCSAKELINNYDLIWEHIPEEDVQKLNEAYNFSRKNGTITNEKFRVKELNGDGYRTMIVRASHSLDENGQQATFGNIMEITENEERKVELLKTREELNAIINSLNDIIFQVTSEGEIVEIWTDNKLIFGFTEDELLNKSFTDIFGDDCSNKFQKMVAAITETAKSVEDRCEVSINNEIKYFNVRAVLLSGENQSVPQYLFTLQDITELKNVQEETERLAEILKEATRIGNMGAWSFNFASQEVVWSDQLYTIFEIDKSIKNEELYQQFIVRHYPEDIARLNESVARAQLYGEDYEYEQRLYFPGAPDKIISGKATVVKDSEGNNIGITGICQDITERKNKELISLRNQKFLEDASRIALVGAWEYDVVNDTRIWSDEIYRIYEMDKSIVGDELFKKSRELFYPDERANINTLIQNAIDYGIEYRIKHRILLPDGRIKYIDCKGTPVKDGSGNVVSILGVCQDITEKKNKELSSLRVEKFLLDAGQVASVGTWEYDVKSGIRKWSDEIYRIFEIPTEIVGQELLDLSRTYFHPDDREFIDAVVDSAIEKGEDYRFEYRIMLPDGRIKYIDCKGSPVKDHLGNVISSMGVCQEVTERKLLEQDLHKKEELLEAVANASVIFLSEPDIKSAFDKVLKLFVEKLDINRASLFKNYHNDSGELVTGKIYGWANDEDQTDGFNAAAYAISLTKNGFSEWFPALNKGEIVSGNTIDFSETIRNIIAPRNIKSLLSLPISIYGKFWGFITFADCTKLHEWSESDITVLKTAANIIGNSLEKDDSVNALRLSETKYKSVVNTMAEGVLLKDMNGVIIACNKSSEKILGYTSEELIGRTLLEGFRKCIHEDGSPYLTTEFPSVLTLKTGQAVTNEVMGVIRSENDIRWLSINAQLIHANNSEMMSGIVLTITDITERKSAEFETRKLSLVAKNTSNAVIIMDPASKIEWVNEGFEKLTGYTLEEVEGKTPGSFLNGEETNNETLNYLREKIKINESVTSVLLNYNKSGKKYWSSINIEPVFNDKGVLQNYISISNDITEKKQAEETTKTNLQEKELLLAEIHHRVKNNLAIISSLLQLQQLYTSDGIAKDMFKESQGRITSMALVHEKLYQNSNFSKVDFKLYISEIFTVIQAAYPVVNTEIKFETKVENIELDITTAVPCGLMLNELLTNCYKYAFKGRKTGEIKVTFEQKGDYLVLEVEDNGIGLPSSFNIDKVKSMGMTIIKTLATQLKGKLSVNNKNGSQFILTFPVKN